eukprot:10355742-Alexandrium_andersonii.AAC.1
MGRKSTPQQLRRLRCLGAQQSHQTDWRCYGMPARGHSPSLDELHALGAQGVHGALAVSINFKITSVIGTASAFAACHSWISG